MHEMMQIGSKKWQNLIYEGAKDLDIQIDKRKIEKFAIHALELMKWNQKTNQEMAFGCKINEYV